MFLSTLQYCLYHLYHFTTTIIVTMVCANNLVTFSHICKFRLHSIGVAVAKWTLFTKSFNVFIKGGQLALPPMLQFAKMRPGTISNGLANSFQPTYRFILITSNEPGHGFGFLRHVFIHCFSLGKHGTNVIRS